MSEQPTRRSTGAAGAASAATSATSASALTTGATSVSASSAAGISLASTTSDLAVALPTDSTSLTAASMLPVGLLADKHSLILADDVTADEVESLTLSLDPHAAWVGASQLQLIPGVQLLGPWPVESELHEVLELPEWAAQLMILDCPPERSGPLPAELAGVDPLADAFPLAQPTGNELRALRYLLAMARRLAGGLLLQGDAPEAAGAHALPERSTREVVLLPDPLAAVDLTVYAPVWLTPDALEAGIADALPGASTHMHAVSPLPSDGVPAAEMERLADMVGAEQLDFAWRQAQEQRAAEEASLEAAEEAGEALEIERAGYEVAAPIDDAHLSWGRVVVQAEEAEALPLSVMGEPWAVEGVVSYRIAWMPIDIADRAPERLTPDRRAEREAATELIEATALAVERLTTGRTVDEDGFLI